MTDKQRLILQQQRLRMLYSLGDFQLALSAAAFLAECEGDAKYSKVELRRFRCYETTMIMAYTRPFSESRGAIPQLSLKMTRAKLSDDQRKLHKRMILLRNKVIAHSDSEMMRMVSKAKRMHFGEDFTFVNLQAVFDEGLTFLGLDLINLSDLISTVHDATYGRLLSECQEQPTDFDLRRDYLNHYED